MAEDLDAVMADIETRMQVEGVERRGAVVLCLAQLAGEVMRAALAAGIPYAMAQEMAQDYWASEMATTEVVEAGSVEDE